MRALSTPVFFAFGDAQPQMISSGNDSRVFSTSSGRLLRALGICGCASDKNPYQNIHALLKSLALVFVVCARDDGRHHFETVAYEGSFVPFFPPNQIGVLLLCFFFFLFLFDAEFG